MVKAIFPSASLLPFRQDWHSSPFFLAYPFIKLCLLMFQICGYSPVPAPSLPAPDLLVSLCRRILPFPLEGGSEGRGAPTPVHTCLKPPSPSGLLHRAPALLHTSEMELSLPAPAWAWLPTVTASPSSQGVFSQDTFPGA